MADSGALVGRDREIQDLTEWINSIQAGARIVTVEGPAGIGKTTLARWAAREARRRRYAVASAGATSADLEPPYGLWERLAVSAGWDPMPLHYQSSDNPGAFRWLVDSIDRTDRPLLLIVDDIHEADEGSVGLMAQMASFVDEQPLLVLAVMRQASAHQSPRARRLLEVLSSGTETLLVGPLDRDAAVDIAVRHGGDEVAVWAREHGVELHAMTRGNPMSIVDLAGDLRDRLDHSGGEIAGSGLGQRRSSSMVQRQLGALDPRTREVLGVIAVGAGDGGIGLVSDVIGSDISREIDAAVAAGVLAKPTGDEPLQFTHSLFADELRSNLGRASELHLLIAEAMGRRTLSTSSDVVMLRHLIAAGERAADHDLDSQIERALHTARTFGDAPLEAELLEMRCRRLNGPAGSALLVELADAHYRSGDRRAGRDAAARALAVAESDDDVVSCIVSLSRGADYDAMAPALASAVDQAIAQVDDHHPQRWLLLVILAELSVTVPIIEGSDDRVFNWTVDGARAQQLLNDAEAALPAHARDDDRARFDLAWARVVRDPAQADDRRDRLASALICVTDDITRGEIAGRLAVDELIRGRRGAVDDALDEIVRVSRRRGDLRLMWLEQRFRATLALASGDVDRAVHLGQRAFDVGARADEPARWSTHLAHIVGCSFETGESVVMDQAPGPLTHPLFRAGLAWGAAMSSPSAVRESSVRRLVAELRTDDRREANWLLKATLVADAVWRCGWVDIASELTPMLTPFANLIAVDENAHYCHGAVARPLAGLLSLTGQNPAVMEAEARLFDHEAGLLRFVLQGDLDRLSRSTRAGLDDGSAGELAQLVRAATEAGLPRIADAAARLLHPNVENRLTDRQRIVLKGLVDGRTYGQIASEIGYSHSVVRKEVIAIYATLGTTGRDEMLAVVAELGLV